jgi:hypothetical protein
MWSNPLCSLPSVPPVSSSSVFENSSTTNAQQPVTLPPLTAPVSSSRSIPSSSDPCQSLLERVIPGPPPYPLVAGQQADAACSIWESVKNEGTSKAWYSQKDSHRPSTGSV